MKVKVLIEGHAQGHDSTHFAHEFLKHIMGAGFFAHDPRPTVRLEMVQEQEQGQEGVIPESTRPTGPVVVPATKVKGKHK